MTKATSQDQKFFAIALTMFVVFLTGLFILVSNEAGVPLPTPSEVPHLHPMLAILGSMR